MKLITLTNPTVNFAELALICNTTDTLLLRQDAVFLARRTDISWPCINVVALSTDLTVRNITPAAGISIINDTEWVQLTAKAVQVMLWR